MYLYILCGKKIMQIRENNVLLHSKTIQKRCPQNPKFEIFYALFSGFIGQFFFSVYTWIILFKTNKSQCKMHLIYIYLIYIFYKNRNSIAHAKLIASYQHYWWILRYVFSHQSGAATILFPAKDFSQSHATFVTGSQFFIKTLSEREDTEEFVRGRVRASVAWL